MAGNELKDAKITLKLEVDDSALRQAESRPGAVRRGGGRGQSRPGGRPPAPGRDDVRREIETRERVDRMRARRLRRGNRPGRDAGGGGQGGRGGRKGRSFIAGTIKALAGVATVSTLADTVGVMAREGQGLLDDDQIFSKSSLWLIEKAIGFPLEQVGNVIRSVESLAPAVAAMTGTPITVARSNQLLGMGLGVNEIAELAKQQAAIASIESSFRTQRRKIGKGAVAKQLVTGAEEIKADVRKILEDAAGTTK